MYHGTDVMV